MDNSNDITLSKKQFDILVVGSGLAGLYAAHYGSNYGKVALITKSTLEISNSYWAQGGIAAALDREDSTIFHLEDTIKAGRGLCNVEASEVLVREGIDRVKELIDLGMEFDSADDGLDLGLESGHSRRRILHAGGSSTGKAIVDFLILSVKSNPNVSIIENATATDLLSDGSSCFGAVLRDERAKRNMTLRAKSTILAMGGSASLYFRTTNPPTATGDGIAIAWRAGAEVTDMEFVQFHPTVLYIEGREGFLISEALRGEGAHLINHTGQRFMPSYHRLAELAPRDVVSKAIFDEINTSPLNHVYLTLQHLDPEFIKKRFPDIHAKCLEVGIDITADPIPVAPAAHYSIGGVRAGLMSETNIGGLFACGEVACNGVHGANRLASNSLLECLVFSKRAVDGALSGPVKLPGPLDPPLEEFTHPGDNDAVGRAAFFKLKTQLLNVMNGFVGITRNGAGLKKAVTEIEKISKLRNRISGPYGKRLDNMTTVCSLMAKSALLRTETRGAHIRDDFPQEDPGWKSHIVWCKDADPRIEEC